MPFNRGLNRFSGPPLPAGLPWPSRINASGIAAARPPACPANAGLLYLATDTAGGTLYRSTGTAWVACGAGASGGGTVTTVSVTTANGVSGSVANATTTPAITLTLGAITPTSVNGITLSGASTPTLAVTGTTTVSGGNTGDQTLTSLGGTTVGQAVFTLTNPSAITFLRMNADNSVSALSASSFRTAIGAGTGGGTVTSVATDSTLSGGTITTTGTLGINLANANTWTAEQTFSLTDSATNTVSEAVATKHASSGTPAAGFGSSIAAYLNSATVADRQGSLIRTTWATATDATRKARLALIAYTDITEREGFRVEGGASATLISFFGATAVAQQTGDAGTSLVTLGLMSGTPTFAAANLTGTVTTSYINLQDQKSSGTSGGTATSGSWQTHTLNTEVTDTGSQCSLSSNQFTLSAGTYRIKAQAAFYECDRAQIRIQNVTAGTTLALGLNVNTGMVGDTVTLATVAGRFTVAASQALELQYRVLTTKTSSGLGLANSWGTEVFAMVELEKEAT